MPESDAELHPLIQRLAQFVNSLRAAGLTVGTNQLLTLVEALGYIDWRDPALFYEAAECVLVNRGSDRSLFRQVFMQFWFGILPAGQQEIGGSSLSDSPTGGSGSVNLKLAPTQAEDSTSLDEDSDPEAAIYSHREVLRRKDFGRMDEAELAQIEQFLANFRLDLAKFRTRRYQHGKGQRIDFRRSLRRNLRYGGEWLRWDRRQRQLRQRPMIVLADISGSMERYSRLLLLFSHALARGYQPGVEVFVFGTQLTRITPAFEGRDSIDFMTRISRLAPDWSGGTRIGESLETFNMKWGRRMLSRQAVVLLISDGWDRGNPDLLARQVARLQRTSDSLIWLNPLLGSEGYQVKTRGMLAALPHVDYFLPAHNLRSLEDLGMLLQQLADPSRARRQLVQLKAPRRLAA